MNAPNMIAGLLMVAVSPMAMALDAACKPIVDASEKKMNQAAWHSIATLKSGAHIESMKAGGGFFSNVGGVWTKTSANFDTAEKDMIRQMNSGEIKLTLCKSLGSEVVDGVPVNVVSSRIEMPGAPAADPKLYIGKSDGLPYRQAAGTVDVVYRYKNVSAPKI